jgi:hypothetical protein
MKKTKHRLHMYGTKIQLQMAGDFLYANPPVLQYGTLQWGKFEEIEQAGYEFMEAALKNWRKQGKLGLTQDTAFAPAEPFNDISASRFFVVCFLCTIRLLIARKKNHLSGSAMRVAMASS